MRFNEALAYLNIIFSDSNLCSATRLKKGLMYFINSYELNELLEDMCNTPRALEEAAELSYIHENGFKKIVLISSKISGCKLRLHIWEPCTSHVSSTGDIHNHRWDFSSYILSGSYYAEEFKSCLEGGTKHLYTYYSPQGNNVFRLDYKGKTCIDKTSSSTMYQGSLYTLSSGILHRVFVNSNEPTVTVVLHGEAVNNCTSVLKEKLLSKYRDGNKVPIQLIRQDELVEQLRRVQKIL